MSSARKRAARQKEAAEQDRLRQALMLERHHGDVLNTMATEIARRHDMLHKTLTQVFADAQAQDVLSEWWPMMEDALMGPNELGHRPETAGGRNGSGGPTGSATNSQER